MSLLEWISLASLCLAGAASPGPSLAVVINASITGGRLAGLATAWGHALGVGLYATLTVLGLSALITSVDGLFIALQTAGALYLLWLAQGLWRNTTEPATDNGQHHAGTASTARNGFAIAFLNPKLAVFMFALFSQFVRPDAGTGTHVLLIATATLIDGLWYTLITLVFTQDRWIERLRRKAALLDRVFAVLLAMVALVILFRAAQSLL